MAATVGSASARVSSGGSRREATVEAKEEKRLSAAHAMGSSERREARKQLSGRVRVRVKVGVRAGCRAHPHP